MRRRSAYLALQRLDDRTLKDIGVYRCELWRVAAGDVRRESAIAASEPFAGEASAPANDNPVSCGPRRPAVCRGGHANDERRPAAAPDRKSTRLNSSH